MGVSVEQFGCDVSWREAFDLTMGALRDTRTPLFAAYQGWAFPASMPELLTLAASIGDADAAERVMPWTLGEQQRAREAAVISDEDRREAAALLASVSAFRDRDEFPTT